MRLKGKRAEAVSHRIFEYDPWNTSGMRVGAEVMESRWSRATSEEELTRKQLVDQECGGEEVRAKMLPGS